MISYLTTATSGEISIGNLSFSDRFLLVENFRIYLPNNNLEFRAESIHAEYHLSQILWKHLQNKTLMDNIYVNNPYLRYHYERKKMKNRTSRPQDMHKKNLPDLAKFFEELQISDGQVDFSVDMGVYRIREHFDEVHGSIQTDGKVLARLDGLTTNKAPFKANFDLSDRIFKHFDAEVTNYQPLDMYIIAIDSLQAVYDINFAYEPGNMHVDAGISDVTVEVANQHITADSLDVFGNHDSMAISFVNPVAEGNPVTAECTLYNVYSSSIAIDANLQGNHIDISDYQPYIKGFGNAKARMTGQLRDFVIKAEADADSLFLGNQKFENAAVTAEITKHDVRFDVQNLEWLRNRMISNGYYDYSHISEISATSDTMRYQIGNIQLMGKVSAEYKEGLSSPSVLNVTDLTLYTPDFFVDKLALTASFDMKTLKLDMHRLHNDLSLTAGYDLQTDKFDLNLDLRRFKISQSLNIYTFPTASGTMKVFGNRDSINFDSNLRFYDQYFGKFDGRVKTKAILDLQNNSSYLELHTQNAKFNFEELQIDMIAAGNLDSISTSRFEINNEINIDADIFLKPAFGWKMKFEGRQLDLRDQIKYFVDYQSLENYDGEIDLEIDIDSRDKGVFNALTTIRNLRIDELQNLNLDLAMAGNKEKIEISQGVIKVNNDPVGNLSGCITILPEYCSDLSAKIDSLSLSTILPESDFHGFCDGLLSYKTNAAGNLLQLQIKADNLQTADLKIDNIDLDIAQQDSLLIVNKLSAQIDKNTLLDANGAIGYNIFNGSSFNSPQQIEIAFEGDLLKLLRRNIDYIKSGKSNSSIDLIASMNENGLNVISADFLLNGSGLRLKDQIENINDINIDCQIRDNILNLKDLSGKIGNGKLLIENSVGYNDEDLSLHLINLGQILIFTSDNGIRFYLPGYTQKNSLSSLVLKGRGSHYLRIFNEDDTPLMLGDIILNQAEILYPPNSENLTKIINGFTSDLTSNWSLKRKDKNKKEIVEPEQEEFAPLPLNLDLYLVTGENVRYVTYPFQIIFLHDSYVYLSYLDEVLTIPDANFVSEDGEAELVGSVLEVDNIQLSYNQKINQIGLEAVFSRKVADGTQIQLVITDEGDGNFPNNLKMSLVSDNIYDLTDTEKLFRLRYGRGLDDLPAEERNNLMQNDLIQTAGSEIENMLISPVINQLELYISRTLDIDYFQMETSFIYNLLSNNSDLYGDTEDFASKYSADNLLENLSFKAGKYIMDDLLLNYKVTFEKIYDADLQTEIGVYHTISFRYDMPMDIEFLYEYNIDPWENDSHEYSFNRSVRFDDLSDLFYKVFYPRKITDIRK